MTETQFNGPMRSGDRGVETKRVQEWLTYHGHAVVIDGQFGPATRRALGEFQDARKLPVSGETDQQTFDALVEPMVAAMRPIPVEGRPLAALLLAYAQQHWRQHPREIGGENRGPWVRLYMAGNEGRECPWCAGFATFVLRQACRTLNIEMPYPYAFGCDYLAGVALSRHSLLRVRSESESSAVRPGYLFLIPKSPTTYSHIGIVESVAAGTFTTIEGNTNDSGSPEGYEVCRRTRGTLGKDYLVV
jgi:peptidoglycan hydrolase-like protein with peptidoglycan-binding domain